MAGREILTIRPHHHAEAAGDAIGRRRMGYSTWICRVKMVDQGEGVEGPLPDFPFSFPRPWSRIDNPAMTDDVNKISVLFYTGTAGSMVPRELNAMEELEMRARGNLPLEEMASFTPHASPRVSDGLLRGIGLVSQTQLPPDRNDIPTRREDGTLVVQECQIP